MLSLEKLLETEIIYNNSDLQVIKELVLLGEVVLYSVHGETYIAYRGNDGTYQSLNVERMYTVVASHKEYDYIDRVQELVSAYNKQSYQAPAITKLNNSNSNLDLIVERDHSASLDIYK